MSEHAKQAEDEPINVAGHDEPPPQPASSLPVVLSAIAVFIAALALAANLLPTKTPQTDPMQVFNAKLGQIEAHIDDMELRINNDKLDVVDTQIKQILLNLEQLSRIADDSTREKIERAYHLLQSLAGPQTRVNAEVDMQSVASPENQSVDTAEANTLDEAAESDNTIAESTVSETKTASPATSELANPEAHHPETSDEGVTPPAGNFEHPDKLIPSVPDTAPAAGMLPDATAM